MRTPFFEEDSLADGRFTSPKIHHCSLVPFTTRRQSSAFSKRVRSSVMICPDNPLSNRDYGTYTEPLMMLLKMAAASDNILTPVSDRNCAESRVDLCQNPEDSAGHHALPLLCWQPNLSFL